VLENEQERRAKTLRVMVELPGELAEQIRQSSGHIGRRLLESFAAESYRSNAMTGWQVQQLLGLSDRFALDAFLKHAGVFREYTAEELALDYEASRGASGERTPVP
jgi:hypothetical protein